MGRQMIILSYDRHQNRQYSNSYLAHKSHHLPHDWPPLVATDFGVAHLTLAREA